MKCPECGVEFRGGAFSRSLPGNKSVRMRQCTNDHQFPEPPKPKRDSREVRELKGEVSRLVTVLLLMEWSNSSDPTWYREYARSALKSVIVNSAPDSTTEVRS